ncbi:DUF559 domain-containing protein [Streptomyces sp. NP160]|uniref:DUF559 domain-containing protein n=1 Tax=Streptomyces sp. NP160 TaxID=2586637 RepID=UPI00111AC313|nr:DUF559 domain-containing protein [Streptomyces sp. NP160]TNM61070.1 DUF559 domain-containing protein [Streptomyces sp. NP160]
MSSSREWTSLLRLECALLASPPGTAGAGTCAVVAFGLPTPFGAPDPMAAEPVVAVRGEVQPPSGARIRVLDERLHPETVLWRVKGVLVLSPEDLWAVRCADLDDESGIALGDAVLRRLEGDKAPMVAAVERLPVEQQARATRLLGLVRCEVCPPVETRLRLLLLQAGVPEASHYAAPIPREGRAGIWPDLQWESVRVAVEVDGPHHAADTQHESDIRRNRTTKDHGWTQVVVSSREVMRQPRDVVRWVGGELRAAGLRW